MEIPSQQAIDPLVDNSGVSPVDIDLPGVGKEKYVSVYLRFKRLNQEATQDNNSVPYYQSEVEYFEIRVRGGSEANTGTATPPALQGSEILLADVLLTPAMTEITDADIELDDRRQDAWKLSPVNDSPKEIRVGTAKAAATLLLNWVNGILAGSENVPATGVTWARGNGADGNPAAFADASVPSDGQINAVFDWIISRLGGTGGLNGVGAARIGMDATANWADSSASFAAGPLRTVVAGIISILASSVGSAKVGGAAVSQSPTNLSANPVGTQIAALLTAINARARIASAETITAKYTFDLASAGTGIETAADTTADFNGPVTLDGAVTATEKITIDRGSAGVGLETASDTTADFDGPVTLDGAVTATDKITIDRGSAGTGLETAADTTADFNGPVSLDGAVTQTSSFTRSGASATTKVRTATAVVGQKITISADVWRLPTPLASTTFEVNSSTGPVPAEGMQITVWRGTAGAFDIQLDREDASSIATLPSGTGCGVELTFYSSGGWKVTGGYGAFTLGTSP
jgi:hypothetical protein